ARGHAGADQEERRAQIGNVRQVTVRPALALREQRAPRRRAHPPARLETDEERRRGKTAARAQRVGVEHAVDPVGRIGGETATKARPGPSRSAVSRSRATTASNRSSAANVSALNGAVSCWT